MKWPCWIVKHFPLIVNGQFDYDVVQEIPPAKRKSFQFDIISYGDDFFENRYNASRDFNCSCVYLAGVESILSDFLPKPYVISAHPLLASMNTASLKLSETSGHTNYLLSYRDNDVQFGLKLVRIDRTSSKRTVEVVNKFPKLSEIDSSLITSAQE